jgi:hypothetical protein
MTASSQLVNRLTDKQMNDAKLAMWLAAEVRELGHQLAVREIYGENSKDYFDTKRKHDRALYRLNRIEKKI